MTKIKQWDDGLFNKTLGKIEKRTIRIDYYESYIKNDVSRLLLAK